MKDNIMNIDPDNEEIVNKYWIKDKYGKLAYTIFPRYEHEFLENMKQAQIELLMVHYHSMDRETKARAIKTLKKLELK